MKKLTVKELIDLLQQQDPDKSVTIGYLEYPGVAVSGINHVGWSDDYNAVIIWGGLPEESFR